MIPFNLAFFSRLFVAILQVFPPQDPPHHSRSERQ